MINTIFYFPYSLTFQEYQQRLGNDIAQRTIVFAQDQKAIYMGGRQYGITGMSDLRDQLEDLLGDPDIVNKLEQLIKQYFIQNPQELPTASTSVKGAIKVGRGLAMDGDVMNVDTNHLSPEDLAALRGRGIVSITKTASAGTNPVVDTYTITYTDGTTSTFTVTNGMQGASGGNGNNGSDGNGGAGGSTNPYDDSLLWEEINKINGLIDDANETADEEYDKLQDLIESLDDDIKDRVEDLFDEAAWIQAHFPINQIWGNSNFGINGKVDLYLQILGLWDEGEDHTAANTKWSKIQQQVDTITLAVNALDPDNTLDGITTALQSSIEQSVSDGIAALNLGTLYARKNAEDIIEWLYSGLKNSTSANATYNDLVSAASNHDHSGISDIRTYVEKLKNGDYVATASLEASVDSAIAGLKASASSNNAKTEIFNKIDQNSSDISTIVTSITGNQSSAAMATKLLQWTAGVVTTSNLDSAIASLLTNNNSTTAGFMTKTEFNTAQALLVAKNELTAAYIIAKINGTDPASASSSITISADKIDVDGLLSGSNAIFRGKVLARQLVGWSGNTYDCGIISTPNAFNGLKVATLSGDISTGINIINTLINFTGVAGSAANPSGGHGQINVKGSTGTNAFLTGESLFFGSNSMDTSTTPSGIQRWYKGDSLILRPSATSTSASEGIFRADSSDGYLSMLYNDNLISGSVRFQAPYWRVTDGTTSCYVRPAGATSTSDIRLKNIIEDVNISIEDIKDAPLFKFTFKNNDSVIHTGTSAQYWQNIVSDAVDEDENGNLTLNYALISTVSAITAVKEIVKLKEENELLKARLAAIEEKLGL